MFSCQVHVGKMASLNSVGLLFQESHICANAMSVNYATGLSSYEHKGKCGMPEKFDTQEMVEEKIAQLVEWVRTSQHMVVITGAGISTSAGIPDFRGPKGIFLLLVCYQDHPTGARKVASNRMQRCHC